MNKTNLSRMGGWALILAGLRLFLFILVIYAFPDSYAWYFQNYSILMAAHQLIVFVLGPLFMLFGLLGLRARYGTQVGWLGRNALLLGAIGDPLLVYVAVILNIGVLGAVYLTLPAMALGQICLAIFGIAALKHKPLPKMNWLPLAASVWFPVAYPLRFFVLSQYFYVYTMGVLDPADVVDALLFGGIFAQAIAMMVLGWIVQRDHPEEENLTAA
jgi:hypothetical protein